MNSLTYNETLKYLYNQLPMFQRVGKAAYKADLGNTLQMMEILNHPHHSFKSIHIAGTNGKGSSSHMIASIFQAAGYKTGLYTSPHMVDFRERIKVNGNLISKNEVVNFVKNYNPIFEKIKPSFFEWTVALAFEYFKKCKVDIAIIEVGLGGRLDSTNVINPMASLITNIGFDHVDLLGNTLQQIATEKAGIIKLNTPIVISESQPKIKNIFINKAKLLNAPIYFADKIFKIQTSKIKNGKNELLVNSNKNQFKIKLDLTGSYQLKNTIGVLQLINVVRLNNFKITDTQIIKGLSNVCLNTNFTGRWQILNSNPLVIADTGHNVDGIKQVLTSLKQVKYKNLHIVLGMVNDKDISSVLKMLPKKASYYFVKANIPRALNETVLKEQALNLKLKGECFASVKQGLNKAIKCANKNDLIFVGGSTFVVADALQMSQFKNM